MTGYQCETAAEAAGGRARYEREQIGAEVRVGMTSEEVDRAVALAHRVVTHGYALYTGSVLADLRDVLTGAERGDALTARAAADVVTEIATDRARVREQRDRALDLADAALGAKGVYDRPRLLDELARLRRVVAGFAGTETGTDPEHPEEGR